MAQSERNSQVEDIASPSSSHASARSKAEARRRRILEQSRNRMQAVSGGPNLPKNTTNTASDPTIDSVKEPQTIPDTTDDKVTTAADGLEIKGAVLETQPKIKPSSSTRLAHMRRRRFKISNESSKDGQLKYEQSEALNPNNDEKKAEKQDELIEDKVTVEQVIKSNTIQTTKSNVDNEKPDGAKKYMGVAKMRRRKLAEDKAKKEAEMDKTTLLKMEEESKIEKANGPKTVALAPIIIQLLTVISLFVTGFDVGLQNHSILNQHTSIIHDGLSLSDNGIALFQSKKTTSTTQDLTIGDLDTITFDTDFDNEFEDSKKKSPVGVTKTVPESNIDPVFGVDFDKLTAGDGIFFKVASFAVAIHRLFTYFLYTLPLTILRSILSFPKRILMNPPILFIITIIIRYVGKHVLGGDIPSLDEILEAEAKAEGKPSENGDIASTIASTNFLSMGTNFVKNFLKGNFPRVVLTFTLFKDARTDMYLVLCGFFVGLIIPVRMISLSDPSDEL